MNKKHLLILEASTGGGHLSISESVIEQLNTSHIEVTRYDVASNYWYKSFYQFATRHTQRFYKFLYEMGNSQTQIQIARHIPYFNVDHRIRSRLKNSHPNLIFINTPLVNHSTTAILKQYHLNIPTITFVADPYTAHTAFFNPDATHTCVSTQQAYDQALSHCITASQLTITGHPIRQKFYQPITNLKAHRRSLGLEPHTATLIIGGSGDGADHTLEFLRILSQHPLTQPLQIIFPTGTNQTLHHQLTNFPFPAHITPHILGYTHTLHDYLHAADLLIGKAGPNVIFECCATLTPILAIYHIEGQETGNINFIRTAQIGMVEEHLPSAVTKLLQLLTAPQSLKSYLPHLQSQRDIHQPAASKIASVITQHI